MRNLQPSEANFNPYEPGVNYLGVVDKENLSAERRRDVQRILENPDDYYPPDVDRLRRQLSHVHDMNIYEVDGNARPAGDINEFIDKRAGLEDPNDRVLRIAFNQTTTLVDGQAVSDQTVLIEPVRPVRKVQKHPVSRKLPVAPKVPRRKPVALLTGTQPPADYDSKNFFRDGSPLMIIAAAGDYNPDTGTTSGAGLLYGANPNFDEPPVRGFSTPGTIVESIQIQGFIPVGLVRPPYPNNQYRYVYEYSNGSWGHAFANHVLFSANARLVSDASGTWLLDMGYLYRRGPAGWISIAGIPQGNLYPGIQGVNNSHLTVGGGMMWAANYGEYDYINTPTYARLPTALYYRPTDDTTPWAQAQYAPSANGGGGAGAGTAGPDGNYYYAGRKVGRYDEYGNREDYGIQDPNDHTPITPFTDIYTPTAVIRGGVSPQAPYGGTYSMSEVILVGDSLVAYTNDPVSDNSGNRDLLIHVYKNGTWSTQRFIGAAIDASPGVHQRLVNGGDGQTVYIVAFSDRPGYKSIIQGIEL